VTDTRRRWILLAIPQALLFGGMLVMLVVHPNAFTSAVQSTRALVVNGVLLATWLLLSLVFVPRVVKNAWWDAALLGTIAIAAVVVLVVPTLRDTKVVEEFPAAVAEPAPPPSSSAPSTAGASSAPTTTTAEAPVKISSGVLRGIGHDATGTASIYRRADGSTVVGLEEIDIEPGPDYRVLVVPGDDRTSPGDGPELDALRGNQGTQYYEVPAGTDPGPGWTVLVWCRAFGVPIANATQAAP
jgi:hypothetical protein